MYRVIKVLNNNGILVYHVETGKEMILLGNGVGFGKKPTEQIEKLPGAKVYSLVTRRKQESVLKTVNGIRPEFIEATGKIIEEAENVFQKINHEMLLPLADHIALAAKRAKENQVLFREQTKLRLTLAIRHSTGTYFVQLRIAKVNLVTGTQDSST